MKSFWIVLFTIFTITSFYRAIQMHLRKSDLKLMSFTILKEEADSRECYKKAYKEETIGNVLFGICMFTQVIHQVLFDGGNFIIMMITGTGMIGTMIYMMVSKLRIEVEIEEENRKL